MYTLILNETNFQINSFGRNTYFQEDGSYTSNGYMNFVNSNNLAATLHALAQEPITSLIIKLNNEVVYNAGEINARIQSIDENLNGDTMNINLNIQFH